jgi:hypothetical protein
MTSSTSRFAAALLGAVVLSAMLGGQAAVAQGATTVTCPCLTGGLVDSWVKKLKLRLSGNQPRQMHSCVDEPGFTTFDYLDRSAKRRAIVIDVTLPTGRKQGRCLVNVSRATGDVEEFHSEISPAEARVCRMEILKSQAWRGLSCPSSSRDPG